MRDVAGIRPGTLTNMDGGRIPNHFRGYFNLRPTRPMAMLPKTSLVVFLVVFADLAADYLPPSLVRNTCASNAGTASPITQAT